MNHSRSEAARKSWLRQAMAWPGAPWPAGDETPNHCANSNRPGHEQRVPAFDAAYATNVARPAMEAKDALPAPYRAAVDAYGFVDVYRAYLRRVPVERIVAHAEANGGWFVL